MAINKNNQTTVPRKPAILDFNDGHLIFQDGSPLASFHYVIERMLATTQFYQANGKNLIRVMSSNNLGFQVIVAEPYTTEKNSTTSAIRVSPIAKGSGDVTDKPIEYGFGKSNISPQLYHVFATIKNVRWERE